MQALCTRALVNINRDTMKKVIILMSLIISSTAFSNEILSIDKSISMTIDYEGDMILKSKILLEPDVLTDSYFANLDMRTFPLECDGKKHEAMGITSDEAGDSYLIMMSDHCVNESTKELKVNINNSVKEFIL